MGFPRQEYWSGLPLPPPSDLLDPGIEPASPALAGRFSTTEPPGEPRTPRRIFKNLIGKIKLFIWGFVVSLEVLRRGESVIYNEL